MTQGIRRTSLSNSARLTVRHKERHLLSLHLSFLNCKMEIIPALIYFLACNVGKMRYRIKIFYYYKISCKINIVKIKI